MELLYFKMMLSLGIAKHNPFLSPICDQTWGLEAILNLFYLNLYCAFYLLEMNKFYGTEIVFVFSCSMPSSQN